MKTGKAVELRRVSLQYIISIRNELHYHPEYQVVPGTSPITMYPHPHNYNCRLITPTPGWAHSQLTIYTGSLSTENMRKCEAIKGLSRSVKASGYKGV